MRKKDDIPMEYIKNLIRKINEYDEPTNRINIRIENNMYCIFLFDISNFVIYDLLYSKSKKIIYDYLHFLYTYLTKRHNNL